jgi:hypothetical protein
VLEGKDGCVNNKLRMNNRLMILMMACLAIVAPRLDGQTSPIALDLSVLQGDVGSAKKIEVTTTNKSGQDVVFPCSDVPMLRIYVYKSDGSLATDTAEGAKLKEEQRARPSSKSVCVSNILKPGQSVKSEHDVGSLYEMSTTGTYHVKAELDISDGSTAKSNQVDLLVK